MLRHSLHKQTRQLVLIPFCIFAFSLLTTGCTSKDLYNAVQQNRLQKCSELYGPQREECEAQYQKDYETYNRERAEVLANDIEKKPI